MKLRSYVGGAAVDLSQHTNDRSVVVEVELQDHRTVQLVVDDRGEIRLRGWGNTPMVLGNGNKVGFECVLNPEVPTPDTNGCYLK